MPLQKPSSKKTSAGNRRVDGSAVGSPAVPLDRAADLHGRLETLTTELRGKWQIPLWVVALVLLGMGIWRFHIPPEPPTFDELFAQATFLKDTGKYEEASNYAQSILAAPERTPEERAKVHGFIAQVILAHEKGNGVHGPTNCQRILSNLDESLLEGEHFTPQMHRTRARVYEWLKQPDHAINEYRQALANGIDDPWAIRQRVLQLQRAFKNLADEESQQELEEFVSGKDVPSDLRFWAADQRVTWLSLRDKHDEAEQFLATHRHEFAGSQWDNQYEYLQALVYYHMDRLDDAERILRNLREKVVSGNFLYAQVGWLLGTILQQNGAPEAALALFNEVITQCSADSTRTRCLLKRAECLAELEQYDESLQGFNEVMGIETEGMIDTQIDLKDVRESAVVWYQTLLIRGQKAQAMAYLKLAAKLVPAADTKSQAMYARRIADLGMELGNEILAETSTSPSPAEQADRNQRAREYFEESAQQYLRLRYLGAVDTAQAEETIWKAAKAYDNAGNRAKVIEVLEAFVDEYSDNKYAPVSDALLQLGRTYQASGDLPRAIDRYQENLIRFPSTPAAIRSLIPLSDCFFETKQPDKAEQTLLRIIARRNDETSARITPEAPEYQEALFRLGDFYMRNGQFEKAIARYEEIIERYGNDPRLDLTLFQLADAYRRSADQLRKDWENPEDVTFKDKLRAMHTQRLQRAHELFAQVIDRVQKRPEESLPDMQRLYVKLSYLYVADTVYDLSLIAQPGSVEPFARALPLYEKAAWVYQRDPIAMSAHVQSVNCYLRLGKVPQAWRTLQRARWTLRNIPDEAFAKYVSDQPRAYWEEYLDWLEKKPMFAAMAVAIAN